MAIQTDAEYLEELNTELSLLNTAIQNIIQTGERYEVGTGSSKRVFEVESLPKWRALRSEIRIEIKQVDTDSNQAVTEGASW